MPTGQELHVPQSADEQTGVALAKRTRLCVGDNLACIELVEVFVCSGLAGVDIIGPRPACLIHPKACAAAAARQGKLAAMTSRNGEE